MKEINQEILQRWIQGNHRHEHHHNAFKVNYDILKQWIQGKGRQPVQWSTLIDVLKKIELSPLAKKIADSLE